MIGRVVDSLTLDLTGGKLSSLLGYGVSVVLIVSSARVKLAVSFVYKLPGQVENMRPFEDIAKPSRHKHGFLCGEVVKGFYLLGIGRRTDGRFPMTVHALPNLIECAALPQEQ